jgi:F-type H+-transporting ATPase subunit delta
LITSKVSKRYAKALLSLGKEDGLYRQYGEDLMDFSSFYDQNADFAQSVSNPVFPLGDRKKILNYVLGKTNYSETVKKFLNLLIDKNRIMAVSGIYAYYVKLTDEVDNIARAEVTTPRPLNEEAKKRLEKALEVVTSRKVRMTTREDKGLI